MSHAELLQLGRRPPGQCHHQIARLGPFAEVVGHRHRLVWITVYHCPHCDRALEVLHGHTPWGRPTVTIVRDYCYTLAALPRPRRSRP